MDYILLRRCLNQHNIDTFVNGAASSVCYRGVTSCGQTVPTGSAPDICRRCAQRDDMTQYPDRAFIGYTPQGSPGLLYEPISKTLVQNFPGPLSCYDLPDSSGLYA